jgi:hypothetical protein
MTASVICEVDSATRYAHAIRDATSPLASFARSTKRPPVLATARHRHVIERLTIRTDEQVVRR